MLRQSSLTLHFAHLVFLLLDLHLEKYFASFHCTTPTRRRNGHGKMVGPALASSFRQQANSNANDTPAAGKGGYGSYGYSHNNHHGDEYSSNRGAYGGAGRRPSEDSSRGAAYGYNNNMDAVPNGQSSSMPYSSSATRLGQQQNYQLQNSSSSSNSNGESMQNSYGNGHGHANGRTSPTSCNAPLVGPPSSSSNNNTGAAAAGGSSTSKNTGNANSAPTGSPEEIENSRRTARIHFDEFRAYLDAEGQRGESLVFPDFNQERSDQATGNQSKSRLKSFKARKNDYAKPAFSSNLPFIMLTRLLPALPQTQTHAPTPEKSLLA